MIRQVRTLLLIPLAALVMSCGVTVATALETAASVAGQVASPAANQTASATADAVVMRGTQGLIVAHNAYQGAAAVAEAYVRSGQASPAQLARLRVLNDRAIVLLERGGDGLSVAQRAAEVFNIVAEINLFAGRN